MQLAERVKGLPRHEKASNEGIETAEKSPYFHIEKHPELENRFYAFFGIGLDSVINMSHLDQPQSLSLFYEQIKMIQCILTGSHTQSVELRYVVSPNENNWTRGRIDIAMIVRHLAASYDDAALSARDSWRNMAPLLDVAANYYEFSAVSEDEFFSVWDPFEIRDVSEIVRREELIPNGSNRHIYLTCPFIPTKTNFARLFKGLLTRKMPLIYSVTLQPVHLSEKEKGYIDDPFLSSSPIDGFLSSSEMNYRGEALSEDFPSFGKSLYLMKIQVAANREIPDSLLDLIGSEITAPPSQGEPDNDKRISRLHQGGYAWFRPSDKDETRSALNNLKYQEFDLWAPSLAPGELKRLRYVVDIIQGGSGFRFPLSTEEEDLPGVTIKNSLPTLASHSFTEGLLLGISRYGTTEAEIRLAHEERRRHKFLLGGTGAGKSTLIINDILSDVYEGKGVIAIDYSGELCDKILGRVPDERAKDVIYFNPADTEYPVGFNPLSYDARSPLKDLQKENIVDSIISWLKKEYEKDTMGPVFYQNVRNALILAMADDEDPATIIDFVNLFLDDSIVERQLKKIKNPLVKMFWDIAYDSKRYKSVSENGVTLLQYILSKFSPLVDTEITRNIFVQKDSKINFRKILDEKKILICNFAKGLIGEYNAKFLTLMTLSKIELAALSRADIPEEERVDSYLYLDEAHNIQTEHFYNMISEMRKYRVNITLANQHFSQLDDKMRDAIIGNCGTLVIFKCGINDAELLEPMLYPYNKKLMVRLSDYQALVKATSEGSVKIFTMETLPIRLPETSNREKIIHASRFWYAERRTDVEKEVSRRFHPGT